MRRTSSKSPRGPKANPCPQSFAEGIAAARAAPDPAAPVELAALFAQDNGELAGALDRALTRAARGGRIAFPAEVLPPLP